MAFAAVALWTVTAIARVVWSEVCVKSRRAAVAVVWKRSLPCMWCRRNPLERNYSDESRASHRHPSRFLDTVILSAVNVQHKYPR